MNKRNVIILALLFAIVVIEIIVIAPKEVGILPAENAPATQSSGDRTSESSQTMRDVHLVEAKGETKEWELWARKAIRPTDSEQWQIEQVKVHFFADDGVTYTVTGQRGDVVTNTNDIRIEGNVETRSSNGYLFKTASVFYDSQARQLKSPSEVEMAGPPDSDGSRLELKGSAMEAQFSTNEMSVSRSVRARKKIKDEKIALIQSQRAVFSGRTNLVRFLGHVVIDIDTLKIKGTEASFAYDPKTESFDSVEVTGGVQMTDADKFATSGRMSVQMKQDRLVLSGGPRVVQNGDELVGDEIVLLEGGKKVQILNARAQIESTKINSKVREQKN
jgi:LPS export ABC transporter protein LptC/lipopolysaccharide transport protein LptA